MGLSFLTPLLLAGAGLVAVPLILHLLMKQRPVPREFPALRFLRVRAVANRRRLRLQHLLLLALRMGALALLAVALARPTLRGAGWLAAGEGPIAAVLVFDTAPRMLLREGNRTRLEQAVELAKLLFGKLPKGSTVAVLDTSGGNAAFSPSLAAGLARIERLATATPTQTLAAAVADGFRLLDSATLTRRELYLFTDGSQGGWEAGGVAELAAAHPDTSLLAIDVGAAAPVDFSIDAVELATEQASANAPLGVSVTTSRLGPEVSRAVAVEVLGVDGRYVRRAVKPVTWQPGVAGSVEFELTGLEPGVRQGRVVLEGSDDLEADNARYFTVAVGTVARVLVAAPAPAATTALFVEQAIDPVGLRKTGGSRFRTTVIDVTALEATPWDPFAGLVLVDPPPLPDRTWELLGQWVASGRGLVVWLGPRAADAARFSSAAAVRVLGGRIERVWRDAAGENYIAPAALDHPLLAAFRRVGDAVPWEDFPVRRHWEFVPAEGGPEGEASGAVPVAGYRNGLPAILAHRLGRGSVVVFTTPVSQVADDPESWNTLATGFEPWPFVILANESLLHATDTAGDRNVVAGVPAVVRLDRRDLAAVFVGTPGGDDFPAAVDPRQGTVTVTATQTPGNYRIRSGGEVGGVVEGFSANLPAAATDCTPLGPEKLSALLGPQARVARTAGDIVRDVKLERVGAELSGWVLLLAAAAVAADWIIANRFYTPRDDRPAGAPGADAPAFASAPSAPVPPPRSPVAPQVTA
ncbi:MAG: hypothetical protein EBR86_11355 [Planctomycetia bacterium]|nr:hypothetical protein [Planctomycetia bacterium]